jgi:hypothetical protein
MSVSGAAVMVEPSESELIAALGFEPSTKYALYRRSVFLSALILAKLSFNAWRRPAGGDEALESAIRAEPALAFCMFKNERDTVLAHIAKTGVPWKLIDIDLSHLSGLDFHRLFRGGWLLLPRFLFQLVGQYGLRALRTFAHPFFGYLVYRYMREKLARARPDCTVITANISHPVSLAIQYAARACNLRTVFIEHAMSPQHIAKDRGYDEYLVRSPHTALLFAAGGVNPSRVKVLPYLRLPAVAPPIVAERVATVGIAVNDLDDFDSVIRSTETLTRLGKTCRVRVHDADKRFPRFRAWGAQRGIEISSATGSSIQEFITRCDLVVAGNSSVLFDCYHAGVPVAYYWAGTTELFDYYGLVQFTGCPSARTPDELAALLTS